MNTPSRERRPLAGILNLAKPAGPTSQAVVNRVRRLAGLRRAGHAGTLDPLAEGVLLVCLGAATRLSEYLMAGTKRYRATIRFGATSTTDDAAGTVTPVEGARPVDLTAVRAVLPCFLGEIEQVPPVYAAIKVGGTPLYRLARAGREVSPPTRRVQVASIDVVEFAWPDLTIEVTCSRGTYIRALARDLGEMLQTGAYLVRLVRTASGGFDLTDSVSLEEVARAARLGYLDRLLYPLDAALADWPALVVPPEGVTRLRVGGAWPGPAADTVASARAYDGAGRLVALLVSDRVTGDWRPTKVFPEDVLDGAD